MIKEYKTNLNTDVTIVVAESLNGGYVGYCKEIEGAASQGETQGQTVLNVKDAIQAIFEANRIQNWAALKY